MYMQNRFTNKENKLMVIKGKKWRRNKFEMRLVDMSY